MLSDFLDPEDSFSWHALGFLFLELVAGTRQCSSPSTAPCSSLASGGTAVNTRRAVQFMTVTAGKPAIVLSSMQTSDEMHKQFLVHKLRFCCTEECLCC